MDCTYNVSCSLISNADTDPVRSTVRGTRMHAVCQVITDEKLEKEDRILEKEIHCTWYLLMSLFLFTSPSLAPSSSAI